MEMPLGLGWFGCCCYLCGLVPECSGRRLCVEPARCRAPSLPVAAAASRCSRAGGFALWGRSCLHRDKTDVSWRDLPPRDTGHRAGRHNWQLWSRDWVMFLLTLWFLGCCVLLSACTARHRAAPVRTAGDFSFHTNSLLCAGALWGVQQWPHHFPSEI